MAVSTTSSHYRLGKTRGYPTTGAGGQTTRDKVLGAGGGVQTFHRLVSGKGQTPNTSDGVSEVVGTLLRVQSLSSHLQEACFSLLFVVSVRDEPTVVITSCRTPETYMGTHANYFSVRGENVLSSTLKQIISYKRYKGLSSGPALAGGGPELGDPGSSFSIRPLDVSALPPALSS